MSSLGEKNWKTSQSKILPSQIRKYVTFVTIPGDEEAEPLGA
jgi:hypothetical protein